MPALETVARIEPMLVEDVPAPLAKLADDVRRLAGALGRDLPSPTVAALADVVAIADAQHSNAIEGRAADAGTVALALDGGMPPVRDVHALETRALVWTRAVLDGQHRKGLLPPPATAAFVSSVHASFLGCAPPASRRMPTTEGGVREVVPGAFRSSPLDDVSVGSHVPPSSDRVGDFMSHFESRYATAGRRRIGDVVAIPCAHHRLAFIHPFPDGNGRVARLMSHAMGLAAGIGGQGLWSLSRALGTAKGALGYKRMLDATDAPRQGDRDGRGNLSEAALVAFCEWWLRAVKAEIRFAATMADADRLASRVDRVLQSLGHGADARRFALDAMRAGTLPLPGRDPATEALPPEGWLTRQEGDAVAIRFPPAHADALFPDLFLPVRVEREA